MPKKTFIAGLTVGVAAVLLLYTIAVALYQAFATRNDTAAIQVVQQLPLTEPAASVQGADNDGNDSPLDKADNPAKSVEPKHAANASPVDKPLPAAAPTAPAIESASIPQTLAGKFAVVELPALILDVAIDAELGRLAVAGPFGESLGVYETSDLTKAPQLVALDGPVASVACKPLDDRRLFVVGLDGPPRLALVDATTLEVVNSVSVATSAPRQLVGSLNSADPFVVYLTGPDLQGPRIFDLRQLKEVATLGQGIVDAALSPDGQRLFYRSSSSNRAVGLFSERRTIDSKEEPAFKFEPIGNKLGHLLPMYIGPNDLFIVAGKDLYSIDLRKEYATVAFEPQAFLAKRPWMAGVDYAKGRFCVGSINDYRTVNRIDLPKGWLDLPSDAKPVGYRSRELRWQPAVAAHVFTDERNEQFLLAAPRHLVSFPLAKLELPAEEVLWSSTTIPETATIDERLSIPLRFLGKPDSVSLAKHPTGMVLDAMTLQWLPQDGDFGEHEIEIVAKFGNIERTAIHKLRITRPSIEAPFSVSGGIDISDDSRRALVWGEEVDGTKPLREFTKIAVVDLVSRTIVATRTMSEPFSAALLVADNVYLLRKGQLERLSAETLEGQQSGPEDRDPNTCEPASKEPAIPTPTPFLMIFGDGHRPWRFDLSTLKRVDAGEDEDNEAETWEHQLAGPTGFGWVSDGILWNEVNGQPKLLLWPAAFRRSSWEHTLRSSPNSAGDVALTVNTWHPCSHNIMRPRSSSLRSQIVFTTISPEVPAILAITQDGDAYNLAALTLTGRREMQKIPLVQKDAKPRSGDNTVGIKAEGESYVVLFQGRLYPGSLNHLRESVDKPLHVVPQQSAVTLQRDRPTRVKYVSKGAERFHLDSRDLGLDGGWFYAESTTGEFTLSVPKVLDSLVESQVDVIANLAAVRSSNNAERLDYYLKPARREFLRMLGRPPEGVPIPVRVFVTAENANLERASIAHDFLVEVPRPLVETILDKKYPLGRDPWKKVADDSFAPATDKYPDELAPPAGLDPLFAYMRREWEAVREPVASLPDAAKAAKAAGDLRLKDKYLDFTAKSAWRTWTDKDGNQIEALLLSQFAGQLVLKTKKNQEVVLEAARLIEADQQYLANFEFPTTPGDTAIWRTYVIQHATLAANSFHSTEKMFPPQSLVDDAGRPLLSWRVLLLRQLGYEELYSLFRFNEPWNSAHNLVLAEFMPDCFALDTEPTHPNSTALQTVTSPRSALRIDRAVTLRDIRDGSQSTVVFVEAADDRTVPWTQPVDLHLHDLAVPLETLRARDDGILVGVLNGSVIRIPAACSRETWQYAIEDGDGKSLRDLLEVP